jgi:hypothetical protein
MVTSLRSKWAAGKAARAGLAVRGRIPHHFMLAGKEPNSRRIKMVRDGRFARALKNSQLIRHLPDDVTIICETVH